MALKHRLSLGQEAAEASRKRSGRQRGFPNELVATARRLERLLAARRKLRLSLRRCEHDIKHERKMLKALAGAEEGESNPDTPMPVNETSPISEITAEYRRDKR